MTAFVLSKPVALVVFNRPELTRLVLNAVRSARPPKLLIIADGPRVHHETDASRCAATRAVLESVDWPCEVLREYSDVNLGCRRRVSSGIDWVFSVVDEAIILEDDCVPHPTFFRFCEELLERYRAEERVMTIGGTSFHASPASAASYWFSRFPHVWGWATWRRAWRRYDVNIGRWPDVRHADELRHVIPWLRDRGRWTSTLDRLHRGEIDTWDYQWAFAIWLHGGLSIVPEVNLVSNVGFGDDATHTTVSSNLAARPAEALPFPLRHPFMLQADLPADRFTQRHAMRPQWRARLVKAVQIALRHLRGGH